MKKPLLLIAFVLLLMNAHGQSMLGIANSNYSGTSGLQLNPSTFVENRLNLDINLVTVGVSADNDFLYYPKDSLKFFGIKRLVDLSDDKGYFERFNFNKKDKLFNADVAALVRGLSATFHIKDHWLAIQTNVRAGVTAKDVSGSIGKFAYENDGLKFDPLQGIDFTNNGLKISSMIWSELGFTYGHKLLNNGKNYLKGAVTIKRLWGYASAFAINDGVRYNVFNDTILAITDANTQYGHSFDENIEGARYKDLVNGTGWGFDVGFTYEYRPKYDQFRYDMDGEKLEDPTENRYKLRLGVGITDIGKIKFENNTGLFDFRNASTLWQNWDTINFANVTDFDTTLSNQFFGNPGRSKKDDQYDMYLPRAISLQADYHLARQFYLNATVVQRLSPNKPALFAANYASLTPRYERDWIEVAMPISMYQYSLLRIGVGLRLGSFFIGSDRLGSLFGLADLGGMDVYTGLKFSLDRKKVKDRDGDAVSDKKDKCPTERGTWLTIGCPDKDNDGITDAQDECPTIAGLKEFNGCPDTDNDKIIDSKDDCPTEFGLAEFNGCPDKDGDKIIDSKDKCPDVAGLAALDGCPDQDNDGITDLADKCPDVAGIQQFDGCPDTDADGLTDKEDDCPNVAGPKENKGCPVIEKIEKPKEPIKVVLTQEEQEVINKVFKNLEFETGKSVIKSSSFADLDALVTLLNKKVAFKLLIDGHTDNVGKAANNLKLSQNRANAVKKYLTDRNISPLRITAKGYGLTKPIADNKTPEGRQRNRRVEFTIVE